MNRKTPITKDSHAEKNNYRVTSTPEIRARIKELQNHRKYTNKQVAAILNITIDTYKNIIGGRNLTIKPEIISRLAELYECTRDYIRCESQEPNLNSNGTFIELPLDFSEANRKLTDVSKYLHDDYKTLNNLHLVIYRLPSYLRDSLLDSFNAICDNICITSLMDRKDNLTEDKFNYLIENLNSDRPELTKMNLKLAEADKHLGKKRIRKAFNIYLEIIYHASLDSTPVVNKAISKVQTLKDEWSSFPDKLETVLKFISDQKKLGSIFPNVFPSEVEDALSEYFDSQKIEIQKRDLYLNSL